MAQKKKIAPGRGLDRKRAIKAIKSHDKAFFTDYDVKSFVKNSLHTHAVDHDCYDMIELYLNQTPNQEKEYADLVTSTVLYAASKGKDQYVEDFCSRHMETLAWINNDATASFIDNGRTKEITDLFQVSSNATFRVLFMHLGKFILNSMRLDDSFYLDFDLLFSQMIEVSDFKKILLVKLLADGSIENEIKTYNNSIEFSMKNDLSPELLAYLEWLVQEQPASVAAQFLHSSLVSYYANGRSTIHLKRMLVREAYVIPNCLLYDAINADYDSEDYDTTDDEDFEDDDGDFETEEDLESLGTNDSSSTSDDDSDSVGRGFYSSPYASDIETYGSDDSSNDSSDDSSDDGSDDDDDGSAGERQGYECPSMNTTNPVYYFLESLGTRVFCNNDLNYLEHAGETGHNLRYNMHFYVQAVRAGQHPLDITNMALPSWMTSLPIIKHVIRHYHHMHAEGGRVPYFLTRALRHSANTLGTKEEYATALRSPQLRPYVHLQTNNVGILSSNEDTDGISTDDFRILVSGLRVYDLLGPAPGGSNFRLYDVIASFGNLALVQITNEHLKSGLSKIKVSVLIRDVFTNEKGQLTLRQNPTLYGPGPRRTAIDLSRNHHPGYI